MNIGKQSNIPMVVVVEGQSSQTAGSEVAADLANYLKYSLINPDDVASTFQGYLTSSSNQALSAISQDLDNFSFKIVYQIASAQLRSKLGVVIYLPPSNHTHFDQLKQLANSQGVELLLVQCRAHDDIVDGAHDAGEVRKLTVDTNKPFDVESFISAHFGQSSDPYPKLEKAKFPEDILVKTSSFPASGENRTEETYRHLHCLVFYNKPTNHAARLRCKRCGDPISGPNYQCAVCDEYIFHKSCAELPGGQFNCPPGLISKDPEYYFREKQSCKICEKTHQGFSDGCHDCLFESTMRGKLLPVVVNHKAHLHPLNLIIMPLSYNYEYGCCGCGDIGKSISYRCYDCNFNLHVSCVLALEVIETKRHPHNLRLVYPSFNQVVRDHSYCDVCEKETIAGQWFYFCESCTFVAHMDCVR